MAPRGNAVKHFVAKLVKSFGGLCNAAESLDDFRYRTPCFQQRKTLKLERSLRRLVFHFRYPGSPTVTASL